MPTPTYVVQKTGGEYIVVPKDSATQRPIWGVAGGLLFLGGLTRRSNAGLLMMLAGAAMAYRGATGVSPWYRFVCQKTARDGLNTPEGGPTYQHEGDDVRQTPSDEVDEASMESFPASDPPAVLHSTGDEDVRSGSSS